MDWRHHAICRDEDPELFFPIGNTGPAILQIEEAKQVCRRCEVREQCLAWALEAGQDHGVWGGLSEDERRALKRRNARARLIRDGVVAWEGNIGSLRRLKDDVSEVREGYECGIGLDADDICAEVTRIHYGSDPTAEPIRAEVQYVCRHEMVCTLEDLIDRRAGFLFIQGRSHESLGEEDAGEMRSSGYTV